MKAYTTPYGGVDDPMDPILYMLTYGATYVAQAFAGNVKMAARADQGRHGAQGICLHQHPLAVPDLQPDRHRRLLQERGQRSGPDHDVTDLDAAMHVVNLAKREGRVPTGLLYKTSAPRWTSAWPNW